MLSTAGSAVLGLCFWGLAAHLYSTETIGRSSAEVSAMILIANLAQLNLAEMFIRFLPTAGNVRNLISLGYLAAVGIAIVGAIVFVLTPLSGRILSKDGEFLLLFVIAVPFGPYSSSKMGLL